jgi:hypothetical protein
MRRLHDKQEHRQSKGSREGGTVVWPNGYDLDPDVLHGDYEPVGRPAAQASSSGSRTRGDGG